MHRLETWTWNKTQQSGVCAVEISYLRGAFGVTRRTGEGNEAFIRFGMDMGANVVRCGVVEWVKRNAEMVWSFEEVEE